jgi:hypothetical protein
MKNVLLIAMIVFVGSACFGQTAALLSSQPQVIHMADHPMQATQHSMASEHSLVGGGASTYSYAQGERPLWEFGSVSEPIPLGDVARAARKEKLNAKKAEIVFEKQGS